MKGEVEVVGEDIKQMLQEKFNAGYYVNSVYRLLNRLDIIWITGRSIHPKADKEAQEEFKKNFQDLIKKCLPVNVPLDEVDLKGEDQITGEHIKTIRMSEHYLQKVALYLKIYHQKKILKS